MRARVPGEEVAERVLDRLGEGLRDADRQRSAERVAQSARVLDRRPVVGPADPDPDGTAGRSQVLGPLRLRAALGQFGVGERAEHPQKVRDAFGVLGAAVLREPLELALQLRQDVGVQELTQLRLAEELGEQTRVQRQGRGTPLGERGVSLVQELGDVAEQQ